MMDTAKLRMSYMWLNHIKSFRTGDVERLIEIFETPIMVMEALTEDKKILDGLVEANLIKETTRDEILGCDFDKWFLQLDEEMNRKGIRCVTPAEGNYPKRLFNIENKPLALYYKGKLELAESEHSIGIVGSRRPTSYGTMSVNEFGRELSSRGITIVSGMAYGIDARAHKAAIESDGKTIAVLGGGVDICYPRTNISIYSEMCENHLVMSEYEPGVEHQSLHFPLRNRIISGLSDGVLLVEAAEKSGTLITADYALNQGRTIYGIPGRTTDVMSRGVNRLIKQGAMLINSPSDIIMDVFQESFRIKTRRKSKDREGAIKKANLNSDENKIINMLGFEPIHIDEIIRANNMNISGTIHSLTSLVNKNLIECIEQSYYILK